MVQVTENPRSLHVGAILRDLVLIFAVLNEHGLAGTENVVHRKFRGNFSVEGFSLGNSVMESELSGEERGFLTQCLGQISSSGKLKICFNGHCTTYILQKYSGLRILLDFR